MYLLYEIIYLDTTSKLNILFYEVYDYAQGLNGQVEVRTAVPLGNDTKGIVRRELEPTDAFASISATIQESVSGDYFELFPTYNGEFIEDYVLQQAQSGAELMVIHDVEVFEQISTYGDYDELMTNKLTFYQEDGFDKEFKYSDPSARTLTAYN